MTKLTGACTPENSRISGWFRILVVATILPVVTALRGEDGGYLDCLEHDFVLAIIVFVALRLVSLVCDWISNGFSEPQQQRLSCQAKTIAVGLCVVGCTYLAVALFRYQVVAVDHLNVRAGIAKFMILDRLTGVVTPLVWKVEVVDHRRL